MAPLNILAGLLVLLTLGRCIPIEEDVALVKLKDVQVGWNQFSFNNATSYTRLLFDAAHNQLVVGARNYLFRLGLESLTLLETASWPAVQETIERCHQKGQSEADCHNHIRVLLVHQEKLLVCGTNAFSPKCTWRGIEAISDVQETINGIARSPFSPHANITALLSSNGDYYIASPVDFSGQDPAIYRITQQSRPLRTMQYNMKWLSEPDFVGSFETDSFVYFFFREVAVEHMNCGKVVFSRVARVCKNDAGGQIVLKETWTTFMKARLNCSLPGEFPFYFNEIQSIVYLEEQQMVYATFSTGDNGIGGSAVCAFTLDAIQTAFGGPFKWQPSPNALWETHHSSHIHFHCQSSDNALNLLESEKFQLMEQAVQPTQLQPLVVNQLQRFTFIAVDVTETKLHKNVHVIFVATLEGLIKKYSVLPRTQETCLVEVLQPLQQHDAIRAMGFLKKTNSLYVGTDTGVIRIPAGRCHRFETKQDCNNAMDPYCGWNTNTERCVPPPNRNPLTSTWEQALTSCPVRDTPVNGGWSEWSDWAPCGYQGDKPSTALSLFSTDKCQCRSRQCNDPAPANGGQDCKGHATEVTNCTRHGQWTEWSAWSACSQTCGLAVKTRRRTCSNPEPAHGGRLCIGLDREDLYCTTLPPCPIPAPPAIDGQWSDWGPWDECTASCGGGWRIRRRHCNNPVPENGGMECIGCNIEYGLCNNVPCSVTKKITTWTPWLDANETIHGIVQRRFRFTCKAPVDRLLLTVEPMRHEERICQDNACTRLESVDGGWTEWTDWSDCSAACGGGKQYRVRSCEGRLSECEGPTRVERVCNLHPCKGEWSCWSDWSLCSVKCGQGIRRRTRTCQVQDNAGSMFGAEACVGVPEEEEVCTQPSCEPTEGWDEWTIWSLCDREGMQYRQRQCLTENPLPGLCQGKSKEQRLCVEQDESLTAALAGSSVSTGAVLGACIGGFCAGVLVAAVGIYYYIKRRRPRIPSSPHYLSAKQQNHYVSVGSLDWRKNGSVNNSVLNLKPPPPGKITNNVSGDYPTATIKRNSHVHGNGHIRANMDSDQSFN